MHAVRRGWSESRMRENLMYGLMWREEETRLRVIVPGPGASSRPYRRTALGAAVRIGTALDLQT